MSEIYGKVVLVTGAASGIGRLMSLDLAYWGARLVLWDIHETGLTRVAEEITAMGREVHTCICDLSSREAIYDAAGRVKAEVGPVDILINNAGIVSGRTFLKCSDEQIEQTMAVNTMAHFWTLKAFLPDMVRRDSGHIVTIASAGGIIGANRLATYCASKFAAFGLDEGLRMEFRKKGWNIRTTVVCPYFINTGMFSGVQTRFAGILPFLDEQQVAAKIVAAIANNKRRVVLPITVYLVWLLRLLPVGLFDRCADLLGINAAMDRFSGRKRMQPPTS